MATEITIEYLRQTAQRSITTYYESYEEAYEAYEYYHGRHWTEEQLNELTENKIPPVYSNMIRKYAHIIIGHFGTVVNTVRITPQQRQDVPLAEILNDLTNYTFRFNGWDTDVGQDMILQLLIAGLVVVERMPYDTGEKDEFGRPINAISMKNVLVQDIMLDPASKELDYSDARFIHRKMWMTREEFVRNFPDADPDKVPTGGDSIGSPFLIRDSFNNRTNVSGEFRDMYHVIHSVITTDNKNENGDYITESIYWCHDEELERKEITYREVRFPYLVYKLHKEDIQPEFYGIFRDAIPHQQAINNAGISLLRVINTQKKFVADTAVEDKQKFNRQLNAHSSSIIEVQNVEGIKDAIKPGAAQEQIAIIDHHIKQIEEQLGINPAFLGLGHASDSGRKIEIQREASITSFKKIERRVQEIYRLTARDLVKFFGQYYRFHQAYSISEHDVVQRWIEINRPLQVIVEDDNGQPLLDENGNPIMDFVFEQVRDPDNNEVMVDEDGNVIMAPVPTLKSEIKAFDNDIIVDTTIYDNEKETAMNFAQQILNSRAGDILSAISPDAYLLAFADLAEGMKTAATDKVAMSMRRTAALLNQSQTQQAAGGQLNPQTPPQGPNDA